MKQNSEKFNEAMHNFVRVLDNYELFVLCSPTP